MTEHVECTRTIGQLNQLTRTGLEPDVWTGTKLQQAIEETRLILLLDFPKSRNSAGSFILARREVWFVSKQKGMEQEDRRVPSLLDDPTSLEATHYAVMPKGMEWYAATRYWIGHNGRFMNCGFGQLPVDTLAGWMSNRLVDITASFDEALDFLDA
jgi:hypothetical protein